MPNTKELIAIIVVSYNCPSCKKKSQRNFPYVKGIRANSTGNSAGWCTNRYCEARHWFEYRVDDRKRERPKIQGLVFRCNEKEVNVRVQVLTWG